MVLKLLVCDNCLGILVTNSRVDVVGAVLNGIRGLGVSACLSQVFHSWHMDHTWPKIAIDAAQHKIVKVN